MINKTVSAILLPWLEMRLFILPQHCLFFQLINEITYRTWAFWDKDVVIQHYLQYTYTMEDICDIMWTC